MCICTVKPRFQVFLRYASTVHSISTRTSHGYRHTTQVQGFRMGAGVCASCKYYNNRLCKVNIKFHITQKLDPKLNLRTAIIKYKAITQKYEFMFSAQTPECSSCLFHTRYTIYILNFRTVYCELLSTRSRTVVFCYVFRREVGIR